MKSALRRIIEQVSALSDDADLDETRDALDEAHEALERALASMTTENES